MVDKGNKPASVDIKETEGTWGGASSETKESFVNRHSCKIAVVIAIVIPLLMLQIIREAAFEAENSVDCYYHIALADLGPSVYLGKKFPMLTMSSWTEKFSDKEMIYHLVLTVLRSYQRVLNLPLDPPFHFPALFFIGLMLSAFVYTAHYFKVKKLIYWSLLLIFISPFFTNRILMLRPHLLSITLMLLCCPLVDSIKEKKGLIGLFFFSAFTAWSYSNPHFILLPVVAFSITKFPKDWSFTFLLPIVCVLGLGFGYLFHPQFPNTFINWKIQCVDVVHQAMLTERVTAIGTEFTRPGFFWLIKNLLPFGLIICTFVLLVNLHTKKRVDLSRPVIAAGAVAIVAIFAVIFGIRAMEYAVPFGVLFAGMVLAEYKQKEVKLPEFMENPKIIKYSKILILTLAVACLVFQSETLRKKGVIEPLNEFAEWTEVNNIPQNTKIANLIWSDFPFLIYSCPKYRYLSGMDPMFSYAVAPEKVKKIEQFRLRKLKLTPRELAEIVEAKYAFVRAPYTLGKVLEKRGYVAIYRGRDGWLFDLEETKGSKILKKFKKPEEQKKE